MALRVIDMMLNVAYLYIEMQLTNMRHFDRYKRH